MAADVSVLNVRSLAGLLDRAGFAGRDLLATAGVKDGDPPEWLVSGEAVDAVLEAHARRDPALALTLAELPAPPYALFGQMMWLSATIGDALERGIQFWPILSRRNTLSLEHLPNGRCAVRSRLVPGHAYGRVLIEFAFASCVLRARAATAGAFALARVGFEHEVPAALHERYRAFFGAPVAFGARFTGLVFTRAQLALPLLDADPLTAGTLQAKAVELARGAFSPLLAGARAVIAADLRRSATLADVARTLGLGERTFRRRLAAAGTTLRAVADDVRRAHVQRALAHGIAPKQLAADTGFSDLSALSRAYKRWTGQTLRQRVTRPR